MVANRSLILDPLADARRRAGRRDPRLPEPSPPGSHGQHRALPERRGRRLLGALQGRPVAGSRRRRLPARPELHALADARPYGRGRVARRRADDAIYAMTHLWWKEDRTPEIDPLGDDQAAIEVGRARVLAAVDIVIPGHGSVVPGQRLRDRLATMFRRTYSMTGSSRPSATARTNASRSSCGEPFQVGAQDDRPQVGLERFAGLEAGRLVRQPALDVDESGRVQARGRVERCLEVDRDPASRRRSRPGPAGRWRCCRRRRIARRAGHRAAGPRRGWRTGRRDPGPSGMSPWRGSRPPARRAGSAGPRSATRNDTRSPKPRQSLPGARRSSPASRRARRRVRRAGVRAATAVTRPVPQPASRTRSSPSSGRRSSTAAPQRVIGSATRS